MPGIKKYAATLAATAVLTSGLVGLSAATATSATASTAVTTGGWGKSHDKWYSYEKWETYDEESWGYSSWDGCW
jgi:hypothetical protein